MILREEEITDICLSSIGFFSFFFFSCRLYTLWIIYVKKFYILSMVLTFVFLFKTLLDILLHAGGEEVKTSSDIAATAERKSLKQDRK